MLFTSAHAQKAVLTHLVSFSNKRITHQSLTRTIAQASNMTCLLYRSIEQATCHLAR